MSCDKLNNRRVLDFLFESTIIASDSKMSKVWDGFEMFGRVRFAHVKLKVVGTLGKAESMDAGTENWIYEAEGGAKWALPGQRTQRCISIKRKHITLYLQPWD